jgi:hypothetical protein
MSTLTKRTGAFVALVIVSIAGSTIPTEGALQNCKVNDARAALSNGSVSDLCGCQTVTRGMVQYIQNRSDFASVLRQTETSCQSLSRVLSEVPTASIQRQRFGRNGEEPSGPFEGTALAPSGSGDVTDPSGSGGNSGPGDLAGVDEPGDVSDSGGGDEPETSGLGWDYPGITFH